jgi:hypothetical protein
VFGTNKLGEGSFGSVTEGKLRGKSVAIKTMYFPVPFDQSIPSVLMLVQILIIPLHTAHPSTTQMRSIPFSTISETSVP